MMACKTSFELYHNFPKLAEETGFTFNTHRPRVRIEWDKIRLVDIESLIRERKFVLIEHHINDILDCILESEFDIRILDEGVLKIFRLAQLAVEYQQFCRHYLDRSVYVLREEVSALAQELDTTKKILKEKDEEIRKLKRKTKYSFRTPLPYGNDNIASMILKTLNNKSEIFPTLVSANTLPHNKCTYCDKVFLNQLYLESHMSRRHANVTEIPQKDTDSINCERTRDEKDKLINEVTELRAKLTYMEKLISNFEKTRSPEAKINNENNKSKSEPTTSKEMKDVEVSANSDGYILDKIKEWKKEEHEKYSKELNLLRTQIIAVIEACKDKEKQSSPVVKIMEDSNIMAELRSTIEQQGEEIIALKEELNNSKSTSNVQEIEQRKTMEAQMAYWVKRAELQSNEYKLLLQKLDDIAKEAEQSRIQADTERARVTQLQDLLQQKNEKKENRNTDEVTKSEKVERSPPEAVKTGQTLTTGNNKINFIHERSISLQKLQQKAQELLDIENTSTSDPSPSSDEKTKNKENKNTHRENKENNERKYQNSSSMVNDRRKKRKQKKISKHTVSQNVQDDAQLKENSQSKKTENGTIVPGSPAKVIRAKITEQVNSRLVALGVDPFKNRLPKNIFTKQKIHLHEQQNMKFKKYPGSEQVLHSLVTRIDSNVAKLHKEQIDIQSNSSVKNPKGFNLSSVLSNVKTRALSLVKTNDPTKNAHKSYDNVAKKAMLLLKTPPSSTHSSPKIQIDKSSPKKITEIPGIRTKPRNNNLTLYTADDITNHESDSEPTVSDREQFVKPQPSKSIEKYIKSPTRHSSETAMPSYSMTNEKKVVVTPKSETSFEVKANRYSIENNEDSSGDVESLVDGTPRRALSEDNIIKQTKGVLKNASSTSSLNKKKVIFDMDAIQMKSVSASSPSQSITDKSENNKKYGLGLINLDNEEWDISSIENEPVQKNPVVARTSPKIAELKQTIESQLIRRNNTLSTPFVGSVDVLTGASLNKTAVGGSNTSLGSSILDDTDSTRSTPAQNQVALVKPKTLVEKDDSEIDISEFVVDDNIITKHGIKTK